VEAGLEWLAELPLSRSIRFSRWSYAAVNATHIASIAILYGSILLLDLRLMGMWKRVPLAPLLETVPRLAASGLAMAMVTGFLLFATRATEYVQLGIFQLKLAIIFVGTVFALSAHWYGALEQRSSATLRTIGLVSILFWTSALVCGRLIAFAG
jgi:hypothetical protein